MTSSNPALTVARAPGVSTRRSQQLGRRVGEGGRHAIILFLVCVQLMPLVFMLLISFKSASQFLQNPFGLTWPLEGQNYSSVWPLIARPLFNSLLYGITTAVGSVLIASVSAFVLARFRFVGRELLYCGIIMLLMIPGIMNLVPAFLIVVHLGLFNTPWAIGHLLVADVFWCLARRLI